MAATIAPDGAAHFLEIVLPGEGSPCGALHGANTLHIMGKAAFICAARHARSAVVMARADGIEFVRPLPVGSIADVRARIVFQGRSSMTVVVEIFPECPAGREADAAPSATGLFMMVAVDSHGVPVPIPSSDSNHAEEVRS